MARRWTLDVRKKTDSFTCSRSSFACRRRPSVRALERKERRVVVAGSGGGVLDRPAPTLPRIEEEKSIRDEKKRKRPPLYRVMLHNDDVNRREYVVQVLMKTVPGMTVDTAVNVMQEAHVNGIACVITTSQQEAEEICEALRGNGLISSIEPAGKGD